MNFSTVLNEYIDQIHCSSKELSEACGLSEASISRYRSGERIPNATSKQMMQLVKGLSLLAKQMNLPGFEEELLLHNLQSSVSTINYEYDIVLHHLNRLLDLFKIKSSDLAKALNYDSSFISRIRSGQRKPSHLITFVQQICNYIERHYNTEDAKKKISLLIGCSHEEIATPQDYHTQLMNWFHQPIILSPNSTEHFVQTINEFNLEEYIDAIHFNDIKLPTLPFQIHSCRNYYGLKQMREGELNFLKATVLSNSTETVTMCSDMPMEDMAKDMEFSKKWMFGLAAMLKKGLHIRIIHNLNRPFQELMLGLESWIPLYMTGLVEPYYFKKAQDKIYCHLNYSSGNAALYGECIQGHHNDAHYYLTTKKNEVNYYKRKTQYLIEKASPLMKIYTSNIKTEFQEFMVSLIEETSLMYRLSTSLPIYTIPDAVLNRILERNHCNLNQQKMIKEHVKSQKRLFEDYLEHSLISEEIKFFEKEEFEQTPPSLILSDLLCEDLIDTINYTYDEYQLHKSATFQYAKQHPNLQLQLCHRNPFRNIEITIYDNKYVILSKNAHPTIHFVISHPSLMGAIKDMVIAMKDDTLE